MIISVKRSQWGPEVIVADTHAKIESGGLNKTERWDLALAMVDAAGELIWHDDDHREHLDKLTDMLNEMAAWKPQPAQQEASK
jgi:hypothetical protein